MILRGTAVHTWVLPVADALSAPKSQPNLASAAKEVAEKVLSLVGRAFRHDIISALSSGVLTPEGLKAHFSAITKAAYGKSRNGRAEAWPSEYDRDSGRCATKSRIGVTEYMDPVQAKSPLAIPAE